MRIGALFFCNGWFTRSSLPSSARFTSLDSRCRDQSPPRPGTDRPRTAGETSSYQHT
jgi:hypothetical protein